MTPLYVGCAGWSIPQSAAAEFPSAGSHLARYGSRLPAVEINSSFYRPHRVATYERWARTVPPGFRFSVKLPKAITHEHRLEDVGAPLRAFIEEIGGLGDRLGVMLVQLPPSLRFDPLVAKNFFDELRALYTGDVACEPRHASWFEDAADALLRAARVARVAADPSLFPAAAVPGGWTGLHYYRLHGSPKMYYSDYPEVYLERLAERIAGPAAARCPVWCIFDNTAAGCAIGNARRTLALASEPANCAAAKRPPL